MQLSAVLTVTALLSSVAAFAQPQSPPSKPQPDAAAQSSPAAPAGQADQAAAQIGAVFDQMNISHTGKLTREEAQANPTVASSFEKADANKDGVLSKDEFLAAFKPAPQ